MFWKKFRAQIKIAFAVVAITLLTGGWNEGAGSGAFSTFWKKRNQQNEVGGAKADANRPAQDASSAQADKMLNRLAVEEGDIQIKIDIGPRGMVFNGRGMSFKMLDDNIKKLAALSTKNGDRAAVIIRCTLDSPHGSLIRVLDICHKYKMPPPFIFSM